jgi:4-aminobutyrate aminotransferase-like enzyme
MKARGVLLSTDGPFHNVLKIKPPIVFSKADVDFVVSELDAVVSEGSSQEFA